MYITGCSSLVVPRWWKIFGEEVRSWFKLDCQLMWNLSRVICYDQVAYPEPHTYNPSRFLDKNGRIDPSVKDPEVRIFGSGRRYEGSSVALSTCLNLSCDRVCPGRHLALQLLYIAVARILATFDILPPVDEDGRPMVPEARFKKTLLR